MLKEHNAHVERLIFNSKKHFSILMPISELISYFVYVVWLSICQLMNKPWQPINHLPYHCFTCVI